VRAKELGANWALKIRVDQDMSRKSGLRFVKMLLDGRILPGVSMNRVIGSSYNSYRDLPLFLSDMLHFGSVETLLQYWEPFDPENIEMITQEIFNLADEDLLKWKFVPEVWLASRFLYSRGSQVNQSKESNDLFWLEHAGVVDVSTLGHNWAKTLDIFDSNYASIKWFEESFSRQYLELHFSDWAIKVLDSTHETAPENPMENTPYA
jgi:hypothetical protein